MEVQEWASLRLTELLPLDEQSAKEAVQYTNSLPDAEAAEHLRNLLGDSPEALNFITTYTQKRSAMTESMPEKMVDTKRAPQTDTKVGAPPAYPPPNTTSSSFAPPSYPPPTQQATRALRKPHTNKVIEASHARARDEQEMQMHLQNLQMQYQIYNSEVEPEHEVDYYCNCPIHNYQRLKYRRLQVQDMWSNAVMYPGEKAYNDLPQNMVVFSRNPYRYRVMSPYGNYTSGWGMQKPLPNYHAIWIRQTLQLNNSLNQEAQANVDSREPRHSIWDDEDLERTMSKLTMGIDEKHRPSVDLVKDGKRLSLPNTGSEGDSTEGSSKSSRFSSFRKSIGIKSSTERAVGKLQKEINQSVGLRDDILAEEDGRWPDAEWREVVATYQHKVGMYTHIANLRARKPIEYLHLLRAGYFEPIPVAWAGSASNPLKFSIEGQGGWRGITPAWRGYEDTAEERLYWVLNHRDGGTGPRLKPDFISAMDMARARMASAVELPPAYYAADDTCHVQHTSAGYSKQVLPPPFRVRDAPEAATDDTMILLDVSGSMDFDPIRPIYNQYLITGYTKSTQPKNKDVAKAIIRRFTDAMSNHTHSGNGYDLVTFSSSAHHFGRVNHQNLDSTWSRVRIGGGTRVMTGWQKVKDLHFQKHSASATHHPIYGWQAGPETPVLRLLLLLDGEATDMDEFELDLLGLSWAHVTIFLIGVDGCPHHHRHANELQRISDVNPHVSFVDAQGNTPERYVTHELLKRHLGYNVTMEEFVAMEELPAYSEV